MLLLVLALLAVSVLAGYVLFQIVRQNGRILLRLDAVERELALMRIPGPEAHEQTERQKGNRPLSESRLLRTGLPAGTAAPPFTLPRLGGGELSLADYKGRSVLLVFSDPHCGPCQQLAPDLERHHTRNVEPHVVMVSRGDRAANERTAADLGLTFPIVLQRQWDLSREYGMFATPIAFLIDGDGVIAKDVIVGVDAIEASVRAAGR